MTITINNIEYTIDISARKLEVSFVNPETGLQRVIVFHQKELELANKRVNDKFYVYDVTPNGQRINRTLVTQTTSEEDFDYFELSMLGEMLKKFTINGLFKRVLGISAAVYDDQGQPILEQPVPIVEPTEEGEA